MSTEMTAIRLHGTPQMDVLAEDVYFAFATGRFDYDCVTCNAKCCRGHGYLTSVGKELVSQMKMRAGLPLFLEATSGQQAHQYEVRNCSPGCFFLSENGLCDVHATHGYDAKPETCRLFPFNNIIRVGKFLVVAPHSELCPLQIVSPNLVAERSNHTALLASLGAQGIGAPIASCSTRAGQANDVIAFEREVVELSERSLIDPDYPQFVERQLQLESPTSPVVTRDSRLALEQFIELSCELFDTPGSNRLGGDKALVQTMIGMTPFLRSRFLFQEDTGAKQWSGVPLERQRIPFAILGLYLFSESARRAGMRAVTFQTISQLLSRLQPLVKIVAYLDVVVAWQRDVPIKVAEFASADLRMAFVRLAKSLMPAVQQKRARPLGRLLLEQAPVDPIQRLLFLKEAAKCLAGRLVPIELEPITRYSAGLGTKLRGRVHRWTLSNLSDDVLLAGYDRVHSDSTR